MMKWRPILLAMAGVLLLAGAGASRAAEPVPADLQPPAGQKLLFEAHAVGVQGYVSTAEAGAAPKWVLRHRLRP